MNLKSLPATLFEINSPLWNGGKKMVGLNLARVSKHNKIQFTYRRKSDGQLSIPDIFYFSGDKLAEVDYKKQNIRGITLVLIPFSDLERIV